MIAKTRDIIGAGTHSLCNTRALMFSVVNGTYIYSFCLELFIASHSALITAQLLPRFCHLRGITTQSSKSFHAFVALDS